jgi:hypothetical protein
LCNTKAAAITYWHHPNKELRAEGQVRAEFRALAKVKNPETPYLNIFPTLGLTVNKFLYYSK